MLICLRSRKFGHSQADNQAVQVDSDFFDRVPDKPDTKVVRSGARNNLHMFQNRFCHRLLDLTCGNTIDRSGSRFLPLCQNPRLVVAILDTTFRRMNRGHPVACVVEDETGQHGAGSLITVSLAATAFTAGRLDGVKEIEGDDWFMLTWITLVPVIDLSEVHAVAANLTEARKLAACCPIQRRCLRSPQWWASP